jgi:prepilin peptidase CpaA
MTIPAIHLVPLAICLGAAGFWDLARRKIPNVLTVSVASLGVGVQLWDNGFQAAVSGLAVAILSVVVLYRAWLSGGIGGGDVKLAAAVAIWMSWPQYVTFALVAALAGGGVAAVCYVISGRGARQQMNANLTGALLMRHLPVINQMASGSRGDGAVLALAPAAKDGGGRVSVPYGVAVAIGAGMALWAPWGL